MTVCDSCAGSCLDNNAELSGIPQAKREELIDHSYHMTREKGSYLFREGESAQHIWLIAKGQVKLSHYDAEGWERVIGIFSDNDAIWEGIFLDGSVYPYSAICMTPVNACRIHIRDFERVLEDSKIYMNIIVMLSRKLHDANERNMLLSTKDPVSRIAGMLIYYRERSAGREIELTLEDMAASLNLRTETVSRKLRELEREGFIERAGKGKIRILKFDELQEIYRA